MDGRYAYNREARLKRSCSVVGFDFPLDNCDHFHNCSYDVANVQGCEYDLCARAPCQAYYATFVEPAELGSHGVSAATKEPRLKQNAIWRQPGVVSSTAVEAIVNVALATATASMVTVNVATANAIVATSLAQGPVNGIWNLEGEISLAEEICLVEEICLAEVICLVEEVICL